MSYELYDHMCNNTLGRSYVNDNVCVNNAFSYKNIGVFLVFFLLIKSHCEGSYDKQKPTFVVISY